MHIVAYRRSSAKNQPEGIENRAAAKQHLLRKTIWWNLFLLLIYLFPGTLVYWYAPMLSHYSVLCWFLPVNNSPWELLKLLFWPGTCIAMIRLFCTGSLQKGILSTYAEGLCYMMLTYLIGYYLISGILGSSIPLLSLFLLLVNAAAVVIYVQRKAQHQQWNNLPGAMTLLILAGCFVWFTLHPPAIGLFTA